MGITLQKYLEYDFSVTVVIDHNLIGKSLIIIRNNSQLWLHDLVQKLGWNVARQESQRLEKRSRLANSQYVCHIFKKNKKQS